MKSHEVLRQVFKQTGCKRVAQELKLSLSLIHQWSRGKDGHSEAANPLDRMALLVALPGGEVLLDWLCAQRGGRFVRASEMPAVLHQCWEQMQAEFVRMLPPQTRRPPAGFKGQTPLCGCRGTRARACRFKLNGGRCGIALRRMA